MNLLHRNSLCWLLLLFVIVAPTSVAQYIITTAAGGGIPSGPGLSASIAPGPVAVAADGAVYFADLAAVYRLTSNGVVTLVAGNRTTGFSGDGGPAVNAQFSAILGVAVDRAGNLYIADSGNGRIRKVDSVSRNIMTIAGGGQGADGVVATQALLSSPNSVKIDNVGNLFVAEFGANRVRRIAAGTGVITTAAGNGSSISSGDNADARLAGVPAPLDIAVDRAGNVYILQGSGSAIRRVASGSNTISTVVPDAVVSARRIALDPAGNNVYTAEGSLVRKISVPVAVVSVIAAGTTCCGFSGDGGISTNAQLAQAVGVAVDESGNLYIADSNRLRRVDAVQGVITTRAGGGTGGDGGVAVSATLLAPTSATLGATGNLYFSDGDRVRMLSAVNGLISTVAGGSAAGFAGDTLLAFNALLNQPRGVALDASGNLYIADSGNNRVRRVLAANSTISTIAGGGTQDDGALGINARLNAPTALAFDSAGNLYIAERFRVRILSAATGIISTVAGSAAAGVTAGDGGAAANATFASVTSIAIDASDNLYAGDADRVRRIDAATKVIRTVAGGGSTLNWGIPALQAQFTAPPTVAVDRAGHIFILTGSRLGQLDAASGYLYPVAGNKNPGFTLDPGDALVSQLNSGSGLSVQMAADSTGTNVYFADTLNYRIRHLNLSSNIPLGILAMGPGLGNGTTGVQYAQTLTATGGRTPYTWSFLSGVLPPGLSVDVDGSVFGTPTLAGTFTFDVQVKDNAGTTSTQTYTIRIAPSQFKSSSIVYRFTATDPFHNSQAFSFSTTAYVNSNSQFTGDQLDSCTPAHCTVLLFPNLMQPGVPTGDVIRFNNGATITSYLFPPGAFQSPGTYQSGTATLMVGTDTTSAGLRFVAVAPCRVLDTRTATGVFGGPSISGGTWRDVPVPSANCGVPSNALAYSFNVTAVPQGPLGYLSIWPTGEPFPLVSTLNSLDGRIKANAAMVPAGPNGSVSVFVTSVSDVVLDLNGYFVPVNASENLAFYPVPPCRIADTRTAQDTFGGPNLAAGETRVFPVTRSGCNIPASAEAYSLNMTVVPFGPLGYLTTWPTGQMQPFVSTLNAGTGAITANAAIVPAGVNGQVSVFVTNPTALIIDINGYFAPPGGSGGYSFYVTTPCRISDTRSTANPFGGPALGAGETRQYIVPNSGCSIPAAAKAYSLNATVVPPASLGYLTLWPQGQAQPLVSSLNALDGSITSNAALVPAGTNSAVSAFVTNATELILDINGYFAP